MPESLIKSGTKDVTGKNGMLVTVKHNIFRQEENHLHVIELTGTCGETKEMRRVTIGSVDGPRVEIDPSVFPLILQKELDEHRQKVADNAEWKENTRLAVAQLK